MSADIVVVGSLNQDLTTFAPHLPRPGETVLGTGHSWGEGGKGANQAVAAARLGSSVALIGRVGADAGGRNLVESLSAEGVDMSAVGIDSNLPTGLATITIDDEAENTIVVSPGANLGLSPQHVAAAHELISGADVVISQLEIPIESVIAAAEAADGVFLLNPAPATALPAGLLDSVDLLVPNRSELAMLTGGETSTVETARRAAENLGFAGEMVVTLGDEGALAISEGESIHVPTPAVTAIDPTGAGDSFCGALAHRMSQGSDVIAATRYAVAAGAVATTRLGAAASMPHRDDVERLLGAD